ncbi:MAG: hypothetical protein H6Q89_5097 [Myxococcaceae bacterium]|nr:hypothetical protein [Myxococcaceae bacterium]
MQAIAGRDEAAFEQLVRRHGPRLLRYCERFSPGGTAAEDAVQETLAAVWENAAQWRGGASARAWLWSIARHALQRDRRKKSGEPTELEPLDTLAVEAGWGEAGAQRSLEAAVADREQAQRALGALDSGGREVVWLVDGEGFSIEEAAEALGSSTAAIKSRLHRARLRFVAALRKEAADAG